VRFTAPESAPPGGERQQPYTPEDFGGFYRREYPAVVALAYALCGRPGVAEELAQEAFLTAHQQWDEVARYQFPGAFVRRVAINAAASHHRRVAAEAKALGRLIAGARPATAVLEGDTAACWRVVRDLPPRQAQAIALFYLEDRSTEEIAEVMDCAEATVRVHLHRARTTLARRLGAPGDDDA
jgi:RNA polymerase sigma-70 factor (ECF subfamily)